MPNLGAGHRVNTTLDRIEEPSSSCGSTAGVEVAAPARGLLGEEDSMTSLLRIRRYDDAKAAAKHRRPYSEMIGNRAISPDGWVAATTPAVAPWVSTAQPIDVDAYTSELYHVAEDFNQAVNLADKEPAKLRELQDCSGLKPPRTWTQAEGRGGPLGEGSTGSRKRAAMAGWGVAPGRQWPGGGSCITGAVCWPKSFNIGHRRSYPTRHEEVAT